MPRDSYFYNFPEIEVQGRKQLDISIKTSAVRKLFSSNMLADYIMLEGETAMTLAQDFYGNPEDDFIIHIVNQVVDPLKSYPMSQKELVRYTTDKYSPTSIFNTHHWELDGVYYDSDPGGAVAISYIELEDTKNDLKRKIKILRPEFVSVFKSQYEDLLNGL